MVAFALASALLLPAQGDQGAIAYYPFDGNATDASGHGLNGTLNNASFDAGHVDQGVLVDGTLSSFVEVQPNELLIPTDAVSISL